MLLSKMCVKHPKSETHPFLTKFQLSTPFSATVVEPNSPKAQDALILFHSLFIINNKHITNLNSSQQSQDTLDQVNKIWKINRKTSCKLNQLNDSIFYFTKKKMKSSYLVLCTIKYAGWLCSYKTLNYFLDLI